MSNIFICYADNRFKESQNRLAKQAQKVGIFDKIIKYTPKDLPSYITSSPLFAFSKGGGYWVWKPYIIYYTLLESNNGDIVWYCDSGCTLDASSSEWNYFQEQMKVHSSIFFQYRKDFDYGWNAEIRHWIKLSSIDYFSQYIDKSFLSYGKILAGFMIFRKTNKIPEILDQWYKISLFHPELVADPFGAELKKLPPDFCAHRHDQSILTPLVYHFKDADNVLVLPETSESHIGKPAVLATRWRLGKMSCWQKLKYTVWRIIHNEK